MRFVAVFALSGLLHACNDDTIHEGESCHGPVNARACVGNELFLCSCTKPNSYDTFVGVPICDGAGFTWVKSAHCDVSCDTSIAPDIGCIASTTPVPECDGVDLTCWNGERHACSQGYPLQSPSCAEELPGSQCANLPGCGIVCQPPTTDARCPQVNENIGLCSGNTALFCQCGYLVQMSDCGSEECHTEQVYEGNGVYQQDVMCGYLP